MIEQRKPSNKFWVGLFRAGQYIIMIASFAAWPFVVAAPRKYQPVFAILFSFTWYASSFLASKTPGVLEKRKNYHIRLFWTGSVQALLAILLWIFISLKSQLAIWVVVINMMSILYGGVVLYSLLVYYFFPNLLQMISSAPPKPFAEFPQTTREIFSKGRNGVIAAFMIPMLSPFIIGVVGNILLKGNAREDAIAFFGICTGLGFLLGFAFGFIAFFRWQKQVRRSGIPEEELKAAAKAANIWWPKIKEE